MILPSQVRRHHACHVETPWAADTKARRERAAAAVLVMLRGGGLVSSGPGAVWLPPRPGRGDPLEDLALRLDAAALRLAKGRGALDLAIGESLDILFAIGGLKKLNWSRQVDFAHGRLDVKPRSMYDFLEIAQAVAGLPELRLAVVRGEVLPRKAKAIAPAIRKDPEKEAYLLSAAKRMTLTQLEKHLEDLGEEVPEDPHVYRSMRIRMSAEMAEHLDHAIELAKVVAGHGKPRHVYEEACAMECLAAHPDLVPEPKELPRRRSPRGCFPPSRADRERLLAEWENRDTREIEDALRFLLSRATTDLVSGEPVDTRDPEALEARILGYLSFRRQWDEPFGRILETISTLRLYTFLGYKSFSAYVRDGLGISERGARQRVWLERRMAELPTLRMALRSGRLGYTKALILAKDATPEDVGRRIRAAAETSYKHLERESTEKEDRQNLAVGIRRLWGPAAAMETIEAAITVMKKVIFRKTGIRITDGEALGLVGAHFVDEWKDPARRKRLGPLKREVFARTRGICASPTCSNPADHMHHIVYRSRLGPDEEWNCCYLCFSCHRRLHRGMIELSGRAGERLTWRIRRGEGRWEIWETTGDDDVRRLGETSTVPGVGAA